MHSHVVLVTDHSTSMSHASAQALVGVNDFVRTQSRGPGTLALSHWKFFDHSILPVYQGRKTTADDFPVMNEYKVGGGTPLRDAICKVLEEEETLAPKGAIKVLMIGTDGQDYGSYKSIAQTKAAVAQAREQGWKLLCMAASEQYAQAVRDLGFDEENCFEYNERRTTNGFDEAAKRARIARGPVL